jgi:8-oxo-dGTP diphosphatase
MKQIEVVAAIIHDDEGHIFATQRGYGDFKDGWEFPGGKMEPGESPEDALVREILEELETRIVVERLVQTVEWDYPKFHLTMHCFWCSVESGGLTLKEHEAAKWLNKEQLNSVDWLPADRTIIEQIKTIILTGGLTFNEHEVPFMMVADTPSRDLDVLLADLHHAKGAFFVELLKEIISYGEFRPVENENNIFFTGGERDKDYPNLLNAARKAVAQGYRVFILPNPKGIRTADFIFERKGVIGLYDLKTIQGKASVSNRLNESIGQTNRVLLNMTTDYNARLLASDIKSFFEKSRDAIEVLVFKGNKTISIKRGLVQNSAFNRLFRKLYEK